MTFVVSFIKPKKIISKLFFIKKKDCIRIGLASVEDLVPIVATENKKKLKKI